ncbi:ATP-binding protein [Mucilaginibacter sp. SMC90]|uniref:nSTAND3 domain-containing NTPase n=1 Tax=Mucilaginibacter sp. SMC90 TaxID=2929803 RepID=UPI001FB4F092|nr:ATP-binding protein [Mucilaginibacter sp. SMC90]UOE51016.1 ATP-binding protein [Mucilaginibacter sp. SMC90]
MNNFDFSTLNSSDLEDLVCDLLNAEQHALQTRIRYKTFKEGKDQGIDFMYDAGMATGILVIGQVKHFFQSGYKALLNKLKEEKFKVDKLKPTSYIVATSVNLTVKQCKEIFDLFNPYIKSLNNIYGKKDLNRLLDEYPEVLKASYKLWFSGTAVLEKLIRYHLHGRSEEFVEEELKRRLRLYVKTPIFDSCRFTLLKNKFIIITGEPGAGKTTLAELLLYNFIKDDYQLTYIYDNIKEAEEVLKDDDSKQVFYFDDFLGHNEIEIIRAKGLETSLTKVLQRISRGRNKFFILTTRTFILSAAILESERLRLFNLKAKESILKLSEYSLPVRQQLLRNHIEESTIRDELKQVLEKPSIQKFITRHQNFSPRSVQFITTPDKVELFGPNEFENFIIGNFESPSEIWRHAYERQINDYDRFLVNTLLSFGDHAELKELETAFNARLDYEIKTNNYPRPMHAFKNAFTRLEGGFIIEDYEYNELESQRFFTFINPSLMDFLIGLLREDQDEVKRIALSATYLIQLTKRLYRLLETPDKISMSAELLDKLINLPGHFIKLTTENADHITLAIMLHKYAPAKTGLCFEHLNAVNDWGVSDDLAFQLNAYAEEIRDIKSVEHFSQLGYGPFAAILQTKDEFGDAFLCLEFLEQKFGIKPAFIFANDAVHDWSERFTILLEEKITKDGEYWVANHGGDEDELEKIVRENIDLKRKLENLGLTISVSFYEMNNLDAAQVKTSLRWEDKGMPPVD